MTNPYQDQDPSHLPHQYQQPEQQPQTPQTAYQPPAYRRTPTQASFLTRLFDLSFDNYVTTSIIKVLFVAAVVAETIWALTTLVSAFNAGPTFGLLALFLVPLGWLLAVLLTRVWMELLIVIFKIKEDLGAIRGNGGF